MKLIKLSKRVECRCDHCGKMRSVRYSCGHRMICDDCVPLIQADNKKKRK